MIFTTSSIRNEVKRRVSERVIGVLIERAVAHHCRRGIRVGCSCEYCQAKRLATQELGFLGRLVFRQPQETSDDFRFRLQNNRQMRKQHYHNLLKNMRELA